MLEKLLENFFSSRMKGCAYIETMRKVIGKNIRQNLCGKWNGRD